MYPVVWLKIYKYVRPSHQEPCSKLPLNSELYFFFLLGPIRFTFTFVLAIFFPPKMTKKLPCLCVLVSPVTFPTFSVLYLSVFLSHFPSVPHSPFRHLFSSLSYFHASFPSLFCIFFCYFPPFLPFPLFVRCN